MITADAPRRPVSALAAKASTDGGEAALRAHAPRARLPADRASRCSPVTGTSIDVIATSEVSLSVTLDDPSTSRRCSSI
jgi:hypothetical protein